MRVDLALRDDKIIVFGLCGASFSVTTIEELRDALSERDVGSILYAFSLVPMVKDAPNFPCFAYVHNGTKATFNSKIVHRVWRYCWQEFKKAGVNMTGHVHDGDLAPCKVGIAICK